MTPTIFWATFRIETKLTYVGKMRDILCEDINYKKGFEPSAELELGVIVEFEKSRGVLILQGMNIKTNFLQMMLQRRIQPL